MGHIPDTAHSLFTQIPDLTGATPWNYTLGGYGRDLVEDVIDTLPASPVMLEIGCFLCASSRRWLSWRPDLTLIGIDPWSDALIEQCARYIGRPALTRAYPNPADQQRFLTDITEQGPFKTALANVKDFAPRFKPVQGLAPDTLYKLADAGVTPDLIYIDANKKPEDLDVCFKLWPDARITGDDWHWSRTKGYPMRRIVRDFAEKHGFYILAEHATWVLTRDADADTLTPDQVKLS